MKFYLFQRYRLDSNGRSNFGSGSFVAPGGSPEEAQQRVEKLHSPSYSQWRFKLLSSAEIETGDQLSIQLQVRQVLQPTCSDSELVW
jgi:hypothetical protein